MMIKAIEEMQNNLTKNYSKLKDIEKNDIMRLHLEVNYIAGLAGKKYGMDLRINFPNMGDIEESIKGERNVTIIVEQRREDFKIPVDSIKSKAKETVDGCQIRDFENEKGFHVIFDGGKVSLFPGSIHMWCRIRDVEEFLQWLVDKAY